MIGMDSNNYQIISDSLNGQRESDEQTFASLEILTERLQGLKKYGKAFSNIEFSPHIEQLASRKTSVAVC